MSKLAAAAVFILGMGVLGFWRWSQPHGEPMTFSDFTLLDVAGSIYSWHSDVHAQRVLVTAFSSACTDGSLLAVHALEKSWAGAENKILVLTTDPLRERAGLALAAKSSDLSAPLLQDLAGVVAKSFGLENSRDTVVVEPKTAKIVFRGDLQRAARFLGVDVGEMKSREGCALIVPRKGPVSYGDQVAPLIVGKCDRCHFGERSFPPQFQSYGQVVQWSKMIRETLLTQRMPPFSSDPLYGEYANDTSLKPEEIRLLVDWIDQGSPREDERDPLRDRQQPSNRRTPVGDLLYSATTPKEIQVPPKGIPEYQYFQLGGPAPFDMWVTGVETLTTNPRQLHHESLIITRHPLEYWEKSIEGYRRKFPEQRKKDGAVTAYMHWATRAFERDPNYSRIQNWAVGKHQPIVFGKTHGIDYGIYFIPKGYYLILEAHYMGTGRPETERTKVNFYGSRKPIHEPIHRLFELLAKHFVIPPHERRYRVESDPMPIRRDVNLLTLLAHMHMRGRSIQLREVGADGSEKILASIPNFYYGWQTGTGLLFKEPIHVAKKSALKVICEFDNSDENPNNPDPSKTVYIGQTVDRAEMCKFSIGYTFAD